MRVALTGTTGLIGSALAPALATAGHSVVRLVRPRPGLAKRRRAAATGPYDDTDGGRDHRLNSDTDSAFTGTVTWDPARGQLDPAALDGIDAIIHLSGESLAERWTAERKRRIVSSRVDSTALLARTIAVMPTRPRTLIVASAVGYYGSRGDEILDESSAAGLGFLADVCQAWEAAASPAREAGVRTVHTRFGVALSPDGGALAKMLPPFTLGLGGKIGAGTQWMSWIARSDLVAAILFLLATDTIAGPVNVTSPNPVTNAEFAATLGHVLHRPAVATVPPFALRLMFGEMADETLLAGQRVVPRVLERAGFVYEHPTVADALRFELKR